MRGNRDGQTITGKWWLGNGDGETMVENDCGETVTGRRRRGSGNDDTNAVTPQLDATTSSKRTALDTPRTLYNRSCWLDF